MVVGGCASRRPLGPLPLQTIGSVSKKSIRRNLFGSPPPGEILKIATQILEHGASEFAARWNFDPINEKPLGGGLLWTPVNPKVKIAPFNINEAMDISTEKQILIKDESTMFPTKESTNIGDINKAEASSSANNKRSKWTSKKSLKLRLKQRKITEFGKIKKKLKHHSKFEKKSV